jgi:hypothetical protein
VDGDGTPTLRAHRKRLQVLRCVVACTRAPPPSHTTVLCRAPCTRLQATELWVARNTSKAKIQSQQISSNIETKIRDGVLLPAPSAARLTSQ